MEDKLQSLINEHTTEVQRFRAEDKALRAHINFCKEHKFEEEVRIDLIKLVTSQGVLNFYENLVDSLQEMLDTWNS